MGGGPRNDAELRRRAEIRLAGQVRAEQVLTAALQHDAPALQHAAAVGDLQRLESADELARPLAAARRNEAAEFAIWQDVPEWQQSLR